MTINVYFVNFKCFKYEQYVKSNDEKFVNDIMIQKFCYFTIYITKKNNYILFF